MPTLSVIVPCFNHGKFLDEAVESVLAQTYRDLEIVVVDDGSTDAFTRRLLDDYDRPRTRVVRTPNRGKASANNTGIRESTGRYLLILDADDRIAPGYADKAIDVLDRKSETGIVYCEAELFGKKSGPWTLPEFDIKRMLRSNIIFATAFFRRESWEKAGGFDEAVYQEDYDFWLSLLEQGCAVHRIPEVLFFYRKHWNPVHSKMKKSARRREIADQDRILRNHAALYAQHADVLFDIIRDLRSEIADRIEALPHKRLGAGLKKLTRRSRP